MVTGDRTSTSKTSLTYSESVAPGIASFARTTISPLGQRVRHARLQRACAGPHLLAARRLRWATPTPPRTRSSSPSADSISFAAAAARGTDTASLALNPARTASAPPPPGTHEVAQSEPDLTDDAGDGLLGDDPVATLNEETLLSLDHRLCLKGRNIGTHL